MKKTNLKLNYDAPLVVGFKVGDINVMMSSADGNVESLTEGEWAGTDMWS